MPHHPLFDDPLFGDGSTVTAADRALLAELEAPPPKPDWPKDEELLPPLRQFTGSTEFRKWSYIFPRHLLTEGAYHVAENWGAYWLMDIIGSIQPQLRQHPFQHWRIEVTHGDPPPKPWIIFGEETEECSRSWAYVTCDNGDGRELYRQFIPCTDFPVRELKLYACNNELGGVTIMLPSEY